MKRSTKPATKPAPKPAAKPSAKSAATPAATLPPSPAIPAAPPIPPAGTKLSDDQTQAIAKSFSDVADQASQIRLDAITAGAKLTDPPIVQLHGYVSSLLDTSSSFALQAAKLTLANADQAATQITGATKVANAALKKLADIDKAVKIVSSVIDLATAISSKDMGKIASASQSVLTAAGVKISA